MLLNKLNFAVLPFASKEDSRYTLKGILVTDKETVATDGHRLARITVPTDAKEENYPDVAGFEKHAEFTPFILPVDAAKEIVKTVPNNRSIPIINHARVSSNGAVQVVTTDLDNPRLFAPRPLTGQFPNWQAVFPLPEKEPVASVTLNGNYLVDAAKAAGMFNDRSHALKLKIYDSNGNKTVVISAESAETGQRFDCVIMPMRD